MCCCTGGRNAELSWVEWLGIDKDSSQLVIPPTIRMYVWVEYQVCEWLTPSPDTLTSTTTTTTRLYQTNLKPNGWQLYSLTTIWLFPCKTYENACLYNFQQRMSRFPQRWRTQRNAIRNANCKTSWIIKILNAHCASGKCPVAYLSECPRTPLSVLWWCPILSHDDVTWSYTAGFLPLHLSVVPWWNEWRCRCTWMVFVAFCNYKSSQC
jgi:hypothetical protein